MKGTDEITNREDIIDSRDIIARIEYLESERADIADALDELREDPTTNHVSEIAELETRLTEWDESDDGQELKTLRAVAEDGENSSDWNHGETLIRESYFEDYAMQLAEDIGAINRDAAWPACHIDWSAAANALKADYASVDFDGVEYWIRA